MQNPKYLCLNIEVDFSCCLVASCFSFFDLVLNKKTRGHIVFQFPDPLLLQHTHLNSNPTTDLEMSTVLSSGTKK